MATDAASQCAPKQAGQASGTLTLAAEPAAMVVLLLVGADAAVAAAETSLPAVGNLCRAICVNRSSSQQATALEASREAFWYCQHKASTPA